MTDAERLLWSRLRRKALGGHKFRRQSPLGNYIVDFVCLRQRLILELDGGQHDTRRRYDECRTKWLLDAGFRVIRFWNNDVMRNFDAVLLTIWNELDQSDS